MIVIVMIVAVTVVLMFVRGGDDRLVTASQSEIPPRPIGWGFSISINSKERNWTSRTRASRAW